MFKKCFYFFFFLMQLFYFQFSYAVDANSQLCIETIYSSSQQYSSLEENNPDNYQFYCSSPYLNYMADVSASTIIPGWTFDQVPICEVFRRHDDSVVENWRMNSIRNSPRYLLNGGYSEVSLNYFDKADRDVVHFTVYDRCYGMDKVYAKGTNQLSIGVVTRDHGIINGKPIEIGYTNLLLEFKLDNKIVTSPDKSGYWWSYNTQQLNHGVQVTNSIAFNLERDMPELYRDLKQKEDHLQKLQQDILKSQEDLANLRNTIADMLKNWNPNGDFSDVPADTAEKYWPEEEKAYELIKSQIQDISNQIKDDCKNIKQDEEDLKKLLADNEETFSDELQSTNKNPQLPDALKPENLAPDKSLSEAQFDQYKAYMDQVNKGINDLYYSNDNNTNAADSFALLDEWLDGAQVIAQIVNHLNPSDQVLYQKLLDDTQNSTSTLNPSFSTSGFRRDIGLPDNVMDSLEIIKNVAPEDYARLQYDLNKYPQFSHNLTKQQELIYETFCQLGLGFKNLGSAVSQSAVEFSTAVHDGVISLEHFAMNAGSYVPVAGDFITACEIFTGKELCLPSGENLSLVDRAIRAATLAPTGDYWRNLVIHSEKAVMKDVAQRTAETVLKTDAKSLVTDFSGRIEKIDKLEVLDTRSADSNIERINTFSNGEYETYKVTDDIYLYRIWGNANLNGKVYSADQKGCYFTTFKPKDKIEAKIDLALWPDWLNPKNKVTLFVIKKDTIINIGKVAQQQVKYSKTILAGGADQIYITYDELSAGWNSRIIPLEDYPLD